MSLKKIIKPIAALLVIAFFFQDIVWSNPDILCQEKSSSSSLQVPSPFKHVTPEFITEAFLKALLSAIPDVGAFERRFAIPCDDMPIWVGSTPHERVRVWLNFRTQEITMNTGEQKLAPKIREGTDWVIPCAITDVKGEPLWTGEALVKEDRSVELRKPGARPSPIKEASPVALPSQAVEDKPLEAPRLGGPPGQAARHHKGARQFGIFGKWLAVIISALPLIITGCEKAIDRKTAVESMDALFLVSAAVFGAVLLITLLYIYLSPRIREYRFNRMETEELLERAKRRGNIGPVIKALERRGAKDEDVVKACVNSFETIDNPYSPEFEDVLRELAKRPEIARPALEAASRSENKNVRCAARAALDEIEANRPGSSDAGHIGNRPPAFATGGWVRPDLRRIEPIQSAPVKKLQTEVTSEEALKYLRKIVKEYCDAKHIILNEDFNEKSIIIGHIEGSDIRAAVKCSPGDEKFYKTAMIFADQTDGNKIKVKFDPQFVGRIMAYRGIMRDGYDLAKSLVFRTVIHEIGKHAAKGEEGVEIKRLGQGEEFSDEDLAEGVSSEFAPYNQGARLFDRIFWEEGATNWGDFKYALNAYLDKNQQLYAKLDQDLAVARELLFDATKGWYDSYTSKPDGRARLIYPMSLGRDEFEIERHWKTPAQAAFESGAPAGEENSDIRAFEEKAIAELGADESRLNKLNGASYELYKMQVVPAFSGETIETTDDVRRGAGAREPLRVSRDGYEAAHSFLGNFCRNMGWHAGEVARVVSELCYNVRKHGGGGIVTLRRICKDKELMGIEIVARDLGGGIEDINKALEWARGDEAKGHDRGHGLREVTESVFANEGAIIVESSFGGESRAWTYDQKTGSFVKSSLAGRTDKGTRISLTLFKKGYGAAAAAGAGQGAAQDEVRRLCRQIEDGFRAQGWNLSDDDKIEIEVMVEFLGARDAEKVFFDKGKLKDPWHLNYLILGQGKYRHEGGWHAPGGSEFTRKKEDSLAYISLHELAAAFGKEEIARLIKRNPYDFHELYNCYNSIRFERFLSFARLVSTLFELAGRENVLAKLRRREDRKALFEVIRSFVKSDVLSADVVDKVADTFGIANKATVRRKIADMVFAGIDPHELECLGRECRMTSDFARRFSEETGRPVVMVGIKSHGAFYGWTLDDPMVQVEKQLAARPALIDRFKAEVTRLEGSGRDRNFALLKVATRWMEKKRLSFFVLPSEAKMPSTRDWTAAEESAQGIIKGMMDFDRHYSALARKFKPNFLFVDSSKDNQFPESFLRIRKDVMSPAVFSDYIYSTVAHPSVPDRVFPREEFAAKGGWIIVREIEYDPKVHGRGEKFDWLRNDTDLKDPLAAEIVSSDYFTALAKRTKNAPTAIALNPARVHHGDREHRVAYFDDNKLVMRSPKLQRMIRQRIRQLDGWFERNATGTSSASRTVSSAHRRTVPRGRPGAQTMRFLRDIRQADEVGKNLVDAVASIAQRKKVVVALAGLQSQKSSGVFNELEKMPNVAVIKASANGAAKKLKEYIDKDDTVIFLFGRECERGLLKDVETKTHATYIADKAGDEEFPKDLYYPLPEIVAIILSQYLVSTSINSAGGFFRGLNISEIMNEDGVCIVRLLPPVEARGVQYFANRIEAIKSAIRSA